LSAAERPVFLIIGGPNGSGKSSVYENARVELDSRTLWIVNPDLLAARIHDAEGLPPEEANLQAVIRIEAWLEASIRTHSSVGVETVLSTSKYRRLVELAKGIGFEVWLLYVVLDSPERNVERVRLRVLKGGHAVPEDKIIERYARSLEQMPWFLTEAARGFLYDNSGEQPLLVGQKTDGEIDLDPDAPAILHVALRGLGQATGP
jgi:predicted ABC-type ATPase